MDRVILFEDIFEVSALNPDGYKFDCVNRLQGTSATFDCELLLDVNDDLYKIREADKFALVLATTLHMDGTPADHFSYIPHHALTEPSLADNYEYVMHGRMFHVFFCGETHWDDEIDPNTNEKKGCKRKCGCDENIHKKYNRFAIIGISYGGLLMRLVGDPRHLDALHSVPDQRLYLLLKKD